MSEKQLWTRMRQAIKAADLPGRWERVENGVGVGMPDLNFCIHGHEGWVELKHGKKPARPTTVVFKSQRGLEQEQINWHYNHIKNGGLSWVFVQLDHDLFAFPGALAPELNHYTLSDMDRYKCQMDEFLDLLCNYPKMTIK